MEAILGEHRAQMGSDGFGSASRTSAAAVSGQAEQRQEKETECSHPRHRTHGSILANAPSVYIVKFLCCPVFGKCNNNFFLV